MLYEERPLSDIALILGPRDRHRGALPHVQRSNHCCTLGTGHGRTGGVGRSARTLPCASTYYAYIVCILPLVNTGRSVHTMHMHIMHTLSSSIMHNIMHTRSYAYMHVLAYYALYSYSVDSMYIEQFGLHTLYAYSVRARWHTMSEWAVVNT